MIWYLTGLLVTLQIYFWGIGLTLLILPPRWKRFWPAFCAPAGLALQSAVVWVAAHSAVRGTDHYAYICLLCPAILLAAAVFRLGAARLAGLIAAAPKWWAIALIMTATFALQAYPLTKPPGVLTAETLGSCDAADYAAGARVFKEFSSRDRSGFLGLTEVVHVLSVDNFFDFFLRLNHFTPSALIALNASLLDRQPYELTTILALVLLSVSLPSVFWLLRSGFRFGRLASTLVTAVYAFSPILYYVVYQDALGQLLAAPAVAILIWVGVKTYQSRMSMRGGAEYFGVLLLCNSLLLGSYNFFVIFAYVPLVAYVGGRTLIERSWRRGLHWCGLIGANLLVCGILFPGRVLSIVDRFRLFDETPFGWRIAPFRPEGWYGLFSDAELHPALQGWPQLLGAVFLTATAWSLLRQWRRAPRVCGLLAACALPAFVGYGLLIHEENVRHNKGSYDAFKLFTVFYPAILAALCLWLRDLRNAPPRTRAMAAVLGIALFWVNLAGALRFDSAMRRGALQVDPWLTQIGGVEQIHRVRSINVCVQEPWARLWANYFLLRKPQYFPVTTYEGRRTTPLRGEWDLRDALLEIHPNAGSLTLNGGYYLIRRRSRDFLDPQFAKGWYLPEHFREQSWCWSSGAGEITVGNPHSYPLCGALEFSLRALSKRHISVSLENTPLWAGAIGERSSSASIPSIELHPGTNVLRFDSAEPPEPASQGESRSLSFALCHLEIDLPNAHSMPALGPLP